MEQQLRQLALKTAKAFSEVDPTPAVEIAQSVYSRRSTSLVSGVSAVPAIMGSLALALSLGLALNAGRYDHKLPSFEPLSPGNEEVIWKREIAPARGRSYHLTLDLKNRLTATDATDSKVRWRQKLPAVAASSAPVVFAEQDKVFVTVATSIGAVYLISAHTGQIHWMQNVSDSIEVSPLPVKNSVVTVACTDGRIYGLNMQDGHIEYMIHTRSRIAALEPVADGFGEHIYAIADGRRVLALNARTGDLQWRRDTFGTVTDSPILAANTIIAPTRTGDDSRLWAFDQNGEIRWVNTFGQYTSLTAAEDYLAMTQGTLVTLIKATTGEPVHYWQLRSTPSDVSLSREGNQIVVRTDQGLLVSAVN